MRKKSLVLLHKFWTYFFQIGEVEAPFSNLLSTAINNFIKQKVNFLANKSLGTVHMLPVFSRKKVILCSKSAKIITQNCHF